MKITIIIKSNFHASTQVGDTILMRVRVRSDRICCVNFDVNNRMRFYASRQNKIMNIT